MTLTGRELRSTIDADATLSLTLREVEVSPPVDDEIVVRVEAAPINPSDLGLMMGPARVDTLRVGTDGGQPSLTFDVPKAVLGRMAARIGKAMPVGNEGAGTVIAAGPGATNLIGRRVAMLTGSMYADLRKARARDVIVLPEGASAAEGAAMFVNPLTALGFVETAKREGHTAIVHTAAASSLGQMLQRICLADGIPLVNIVRSDEQAAILHAIGATHVLNSRDADFQARLVEAIAATGATVAFDAIGGGTLGNDILQAMEHAALQQMTEFSTYGSSTFKQLYIYGALDLSPAILNRLAYGFYWSVSGWLLTPFMMRAGAETVAAMRQRVADELSTTFATTYTRTIGLAEALDPEVLRAYERKATGEKYLIDPTLG